MGHASNLGLDGVWLFQADDVLASEQTERSRINNFAFSAWKWGFLLKVERKWAYDYECLNQNPCDCNQNPSAWALVNKFPTYEYRTITY